MPVKLSQFPLPLAPQPAMDAVDFLAAERAFQAFIGKYGELFIASRTYILGSLHALDTVSAEAISAARDKLWFAQYEQADGAVGLSQIASWTLNKLTVVSAVVRLYGGSGRSDGWIWWMSAAVAVFVFLSAAVSSGWAGTSRHCFRGAYRGKRKGGAAITDAHVILIRNHPYMKEHKNNEDNYCNPRCACAPMAV